jgi:hypothetical protein
VKLVPSFCSFSFSSPEHILFTALLLFSKLKLKELFDKLIQLQPMDTQEQADEDAAAAAALAAVTVSDPLKRMPDFNAYNKEAADRKGSPSRTASPTRGSAGLFGSPAPTVGTPNNSANPSNSALDTTAGTFASQLPVSTATIVSAKRAAKLQETMSANGTRRAFTSPDGKVKIRMTAFTPPVVAVEPSTTYLATVVNPRSKPPSVLEAQKLKKKQDDDYAKAIVIANRKALLVKAQQQEAAKLKLRRSITGGTGESFDTLSPREPSPSKRENRSSNNNNHISPLRTPSTAAEGGIGGGGEGSPDLAKVTLYHAADPIAAAADATANAAHRSALMYHMHHTHDMISFRSFVKVLFYCSYQLPVQRFFFLRFFSCFLLSSSL